MPETRTAARGEIRELSDFPTPDATTARRLLGLLHGQTASETQHHNSSTRDQAQSA